MRLIFVIVLVLACVPLVIATFELWRDHELARHEQERERRRLLEVSHRTPAPFQQKASQGFTKRRAS